MTFEEKVQTFAKRLEDETIKRLHDRNLDCEPNINNSRVNTKWGNKYIKVDNATSGRFMIDIKTGDIYGIRAYGQINKKHHFGNLDTIDEWAWGDYSPIRLKK